jgi:hypothetical protein
MAVIKLPEYDTLQPVFSSEEAAMNLLFERGILARTRTCDCGRVLNADLSRRSFRCPSTAMCKRKETSIFKGSFFYGHVLGVNQVLRLAYLWLVKLAVNASMAFTGHNSETVCSYYRYFRQLVGSALDEVHVQIGRHLANSQAAQELSWRWTSPNLERGSSIRDTA